MSIKIKFPLTILAAFILNLLLLVGYYGLFMSDQFAENTNSQQVELNAYAEGIVSDLDSKTDIISYLSETAQDTGLEMSLEALKGGVIFSTSGFDVTSAGFYYSGLVEHDGTSYLLRVKRTVEFNNLTATTIVRNLLNAEIIFIFIILVLLALTIYLCFTRDVVDLKNDMEKYESGIQPEMTKRKDELGQVKNSFVHLTAALESEKQKQNRIIASISHDIKTPLTSVMAYTERLKKGNMDSQRQQKYLDTIYSKSQAIKEIIEEFDEYLGFSMRSSLKKQEWTAGQICELAREDYSEELIAKNIEFEVQCSCPDDLVEADTAKLRRVFGNIISNSIKYAEKEDLEIKIVCSKKKNQALFSISDNGKGIPKHELQQIFDPFYTTDQGRNVSGLGLSICKSIIDLHGGETWAETNESGGVTVSFVLSIIC